MGRIFKGYTRKAVAELSPVTVDNLIYFDAFGYLVAEGIDMDYDTNFKVSISDVDKANGSPKLGDMIARNPKNHRDQWLVSEQYFKDNFTADTGEISDGYHTFNELYEFRKMYNAALFNELANPNTVRYHLDNKEVDGVGSIQGNRYQVHKSWKHNDGELCFGGGWFIVSAMLPGGQISNHYKAEDWDLFRIPEEEKALFVFDQHTSKDVLDRLKEL